jgi:hypothetical protein
MRENRFVLTGSNAHSYNFNANKNFTQAQAGSSFLLLTPKLPQYTGHAI